MIQPEETRRRIERFPRVCRESGLKVTPQRTAVYAMLAGTDTHPTPEAIHNVVRRELPNLSLATVYKILDQFSAHGLVVRLSNPDQAARYDARVDGHQHTLCSSCGRIGDIELRPVSEALSHVSASDGFQVRRADVMLHGLCAECAAAQGRTAVPA
jgi:Fur family peroxide stress response transcriptional regulator